MKKLATISLLGIATSIATLTTISPALAEGENTPTSTSIPTPTPIATPSTAEQVGTNPSPNTNVITTDENGQPLNTAVSNPYGNNPYNNPNSVASLALPTNNELVAANQELLTKNASLERQVNDLETQVNVLVSERSGQLFMYGALTAIGAMLLGLLIAWMLFGRRERW